MRERTIYAFKHKGDAEYHLVKFLDRKNRTASEIVRELGLHNGDHILVDAQNVTIVKASARYVLDTIETGGL